MINEIARVVTCDRLATGIWKMELAAPRLAALPSAPGQFLMIQVDSGWTMPIRLPMSIADVSDGGMAVIFKIYGDGTRCLAGKRPGATVSLIGPLGNSFRMPAGKVNPILVGGGVGLAPLLWMRKKMQAATIRHTILLGARTAGDHVLAHDPEQGVYLTSDDGSVGDKGTVMPTLERLASAAAETVIIACGPPPMLAAIRALSLQRKWPCQLAVESYMACGIGICQGCVVERNLPLSNRPSYLSRYSLTCTDGPVYDAGEVLL